MSEFKLMQENLSAIADKLKIDKTLIDDFFPVFEEFYKTVRLQHLAHVIRAMELLIREKDKNPAFRIEWKPMPKSEAARSAVSLKWPNKYGIVVPSELVNDDNDKDLIKLRVYVAHELGHLFYITHYPQNKNNRILNQDMANVFGVFTMLERNEFYKEKAHRMCHDTCDDVINDFNQLSSKET